MKGADYSLRQGMSLLFSDFMLFFPFLITFIVAVIIDAIVSVFSMALISFNFYNYAANFRIVPFNMLIFSSMIVFVMVFIESFGVIWQSDAVIIRKGGNKLGLESSFRGTLGSLKRYVTIMVFIALVAAAINLIPFFGGSISNLWVAYSFFALMISSLSGRGFLESLSGGAEFLQKLYEKESTTGIFIILILLISVVPVISELAILVEVIVGSAVMASYENL